MPKIGLSFIGSNVLFHIDRRGVFFVSCVEYIDLSRAKSESTEWVLKYRAEKMTPAVINASKMGKLCLRTGNALAFDILIFPRTVRTITTAAVTAVDTKMPSHTERVWFRRIIVTTGIIERMLMIFQGRREVKAE